jgi:SAM-dependent methyltransferase
MLLVSGSFLGAPPGQEQSMDRMADAEQYNHWLLERALPYVGTHALDFGAGLGTFTAALAERADVVAVEPDPQFVPRLRERFEGNARVSVVEADAGWLDRDESRGAFDTILCFNVLEHIREDEAVLRAFQNCLVPGGHLLLLVPAHQALFGTIDRNVGHERRYSVRMLRARLDRAGLAALDLRYVNPVGAIGWLVSSRLLGRSQVPTGPLRLYDRIVPLLRRLDNARAPFGLSVWAVARRAD